jgi:hypothetical protein
MDACKNVVNGEYEMMQDKNLIMKGLRLLGICGSRVLRPDTRQNTWNPEKEQQNKKSRSFPFG